MLSILTPSLRKARNNAKTIVCASNLKQIHLAFSMYLNDNNNDIFPLAYFGLDSEDNFGKFWYFGFEPAQSFSKPEGSRDLDRSQAKLYPYLDQYDSVEICPAFPYSRPGYKPKYKTRWMTYGINSNLSQNLTLPGRKIVNFSKIKKLNQVVLFADTAMVNYWQKPASPSNPMYEEWHYVESSGQPSVQFRHEGMANVLFCDGMVKKYKPQPGTTDQMLPDAKVASLPANLKFK